MNNNKGLTKERKSESDIYPSQMSEERRMSDIPTTEEEKEEITLKGAEEGDVEIVDEETKSIMFSLMKQLKWGMDLTKIMIPCEFLEPRSLLEKLTDLMSHSDIIMRAPDLNSDVERMIEVVRWYLSGWHVKPRGVKKPFNPVLGEVFRARYNFKDDSVMTYFAEQMSHHPPISAVYGENKEKGVIMEGWYHPQSRFYGNSVGSLAAGQLDVSFTKHKENYNISWPDVYCRGIIIGKLVFEYSGETNIICKETNMEVNFNFKAKPWIGGDYNCVDGKITKKGKKLFTISGKWNTQIYITENKKGAQKVLLFDAKTYPKITKHIPSEKDHLENESTLLWKDLTKAIKENNLEMAAEAKNKVETTARNSKKDVEEKGETYKQKFFKPGKDGSWNFSGQDTPEYKFLLNKDNFKHVKQ
eukprot:gene4261-7597_t